MAAAAYGGVGHFDLVRNFASFVTVRALLGVAEGGLLPGMVSYLHFVWMLVADLK
jgi:hypothetical protein